MNKNNSTYKTYTVGELIQGLKRAVEENTFLNYDSPIMISDFNMHSQKYEFAIEPAYLPYERVAGVGLFHSLGATELEEPVEEEQENVSVMKFAKWVKEYIYVH